MKKKFFRLALAAALVLCSCGKAGEEEEIPGAEGREVIVLATIGGSSAITGMVSDFNEQSDKYFIEEKMYLETDDPLHTANDKLMMDITRGERIDLLYSGLYTDMSAYIGKNMLVDLYGLIDGGEISRETFVRGVLEAFEINGGLYEMPVSVGINTALGRESVWEGRELTLEALEQKCAENGGALPIANLGGAEGFKTIIGDSLGEYIDFENGTCNFTDGRFEETLRFFGGYEQLSPEDARRSFADGESLLYCDTILSLDELDMYKAIFGGGLIFTGLPSEKDNYHTLGSTCSFSILSDSRNISGAFEFIEFYTSTDYQIELLDRFAGFPVNAEALSLLYENEVECAEEGMRHSVMFSDMQKYEYPVTEENMNAVIAEISSACSSSGGYGSAVGTIITEEADGYFGGSLTAGEACERIQNRMEIYLGEQYTAR